MTHCNAGVLTAPSMRAALVIDIDPAAVTTTPLRPARYFGDGLGGRFSRLLQPVMSPTWVVPTRRPARLSKALETMTANQ